jgi:hypothetical protein
MLHKSLDGQLRKQEDAAKECEELGIQIEKQNGAVNVSGLMTSESVAISYCC